MTTPFIPGPSSFLDKFRYNFHFINHNSVFIGLMGILINFGSKYAGVLNLSKAQENYIKNSLGRQFLIFAMMWGITRDIVYALLLTGVFIIIMDNLVHEDSKYCLFPDYLRNYREAVDTNKDGIVSDAEAQVALKTLNKHKSQTQNKPY